MMARALGYCGSAALVLHGIRDLPRYSDFGTSVWRRAKERLEWFKPTHAVIPVRSIAWREPSLLRNDPGGGIRDLNRDEPIWDIAHFLVDYGVPCKMVSYEGFVEEPRAHLLWLAKWMDLPIEPVEAMDLDWIHDGNAKYRGNGKDATD
jgi:hypothetical protein